MNTIGPGLHLILGVLCVFVDLLSDVELILLLIASLAMSLHYRTYAVAASAGTTVLGRN